MLMAMVGIAMRVMLVHSVMNEAILMQRVRHLVHRTSTIFVYDTVEEPNKK